MKQEDKQLLFKDLSARLPYHVRCKIWLKCGTTEEGPLDLQHNYGDVLRDAFFYHDMIKDIKPYLRPMSSMTEEEKKSLPFPWVYNFGVITSYCKSEGFIEIIHDDCLCIIDWLNSHHFDYRGLIEKGLAIEVTEENNPYKD